MGPVLWHHFPVCLDGSFLHSTPLPYTGSTHTVPLLPGLLCQHGLLWLIFLTVFGFLRGCSDNSRRNYDSDISMTVSADFGRIRVFPCQFWVWWCFQGWPTHVRKNIFNSSHVCSVLQMDCVSLSWQFFIASCILKLQLPVILRRK